MYYPKSVPCGLRGCLAAENAKKDILHCGCMLARHSKRTDRRTPPLGRFPDHGKSSFLTTGGKTIRDWGNVARKIVAFGNVIRALAIFAALQKTAGLLETGRTPTSLRLAPEHFQNSGGTRK